MDTPIRLDSTLRTDSEGKQAVVLGEEGGRFLSK